MTTAAQNQIQSEVFRTLGDPTRRKLFERLAREGELTVSALTVGSKVSQPAVSQHLAALKLAGLVSDRREGRAIHYSVKPEGLKPLVNWVEHYTQFWADKFDDLESFLNKMDN
jgi:DNA-binding transcriptional ArsR family regulator